MVSIERLAPGTRVKVKQWAYGYTPVIDGSGVPGDGFEVHRVGDDGTYYWVRAVGSTSDDLTTMRKARVVETIRDLNPAELRPGWLVRVVEWGGGKPNPDHAPSMEYVFDGANGPYFTVRVPDTRGPVWYAKRIVLVNGGESVLLSETPQSTTESTEAVTEEQSEGRMYTQQQLDTAVTEARRKHEQYLQDFKRGVAEKASELAAEHNWCDVVDRALEDLDIDPIEKSAEIELRVFVKADRVSHDFRQHADDFDWIRSSIEIDVSGDNDCGDVEVVRAEVVAVEMAGSE